MGAVRSPWSDVTIPEDVSCCQLILARANSEPDRLALVSIEGVTVGLYQVCMQWSKWGGGGGSGGLPPPPPNVQESVQILEIWKQMCKF